MEYLTSAHHITKNAMKKVAITTLLITLSITIYAETPRDVSSEIKNVTVYQQGAQIAREGTAMIPKGKSTLIFQGLPAKITPSSIQVSATNNVMIVSVTQNIDYLNKTSTDKSLTDLYKRQLSLTDSIKVLNNLKAVYAQEKSMILANSSISGDNGVNINDLEQAAIFFRKRLTEIENATHKMDNTISDLKEVLYKISKQLLELNSKKDLPTSQIKVVVSSEIETKSLLKLNYFIPDASWTPAYDIRISETNRPLDFFYKAKVTQNTDENWGNVKLTLSTGNPSLSNNKPELTAYYLTFDNYYRNISPAIIADNQPLKGVVSGRITDAETGEPLIGTNVVVKGTTKGVVADVNGNYKIELPQGNNTLDFSFIGYLSQEVVVNSATLNVSMKADQVALDEVVVVAYGLGGDESPSALSGRVAGVSVVKKKEQIPMAIEKRQLTTEFQIDIPYSIPSDNQPYDVNMVEYEIDASYEYYAVPKLSNNAFLIAKIPNWINYNLLSGTTYIFFKGIYQGESFIDLDTASDTLSISVGRDKDLVISRDIQKDFASKGIVGTSKKEQKSWTISIKNNKAIPVNISVEDQYPVSKVDDIKVDLIEYTGAKKDESTGKLTWNLLINPAEKKTLDLRYSVRYPNSRSVIIE
jgi:hypothetical protein